MGWVGVGGSESVELPFDSKIHCHGNFWINLTDLRHFTFPYNSP